MVKKDNIQNNGNSTTKPDLIPSKEYKESKKGRLFVKNFPFNVDLSKLEKIFKKCGEVVSFTFPRRKSDDSSSELKGYGFVQYKHKNMALKAVKSLNNKLLGGRRIEVSLAQPKSLYEKTKEVSTTVSTISNELAEKNGDVNINKQNLNENEPETEAKQETDSNQIEEKAEEGNKNANKNNTQKQKNNKKSQSEKKNETDSTKQELINDPGRTLFLQNVEYSLKEYEVREFFQKFAPVVYAKICKSNGVSKGTAFVMFEKQEDASEVLNLYKLSIKNTLNKDRDSKVPTLDLEINDISEEAFYLKGKHLKIFQAYDKNDSASIPQKKEDKRNRENLLFGLHNHFNGDLNDTDKEKREFLIKSKKDNFKNNPNLFTSKTRLTVRNFSKKVDENKLREVVMDAANSFVKNITDKEKLNYYNKTKKLKQVKIIRDPKQNNKSKGTAFIEVCDEELAKAIIQSLSNTNLDETDKENNFKGLIIDFALEDIRKVNKSLAILARKKEGIERKKQEMKELQKEKKKEEKANNLILNLKEGKEDKEGNSKFKKLSNSNSNEKGSKNRNKNENENTIEMINDKATLLDLLKNTNSRGKKTRIKNRLISKFKATNEEIEEVINQRNTQEKQKQEAKNEIKNNSQNQEKKNKSNYVEEEVKSNQVNINKKTKKQKREEKKIKKKEAKQQKENERRQREEDEEMDGGMNQYFKLIEDKLKENKYK